MFTEILILIVTLKVIALACVFYILKANKRERIDYHGKHVVVTGGSSGIGWEISIEAFKQGAHVSIIARNMDKLNAIKKKLEEIQASNEVLKAQKIQIQSLDIADSFEKTQQTFNKLVEGAGPVDILINNAGLGQCWEFSKTPIDKFDYMMKLNYLGSVYCTRSVIESMKKRKFGRIMFVSSQAGQIGIYGYTSYSASKFALRGLAECLQMEVKPYNITVSLAYPPDTDTPGLAEENKTKPEETQLIADSSGLSKPDDVAKSIINCIKKGSFNCSFGINGFLLTTLNSGTGPATTFKEALIQLITLPLCRFIGIILLFQFDGIVKNCYKKKQ